MHVGVRFAIWVSARSPSGPSGSAWPWLHTNTIHGRQTLAGFARPVRIGPSMSTNHLDSSSPEREEAFWIVPAVFLLRGVVEVVLTSDQRHVDQRQRVSRPTF